MLKKIKLPLKMNDIDHLKAGENLLLSGTIYVARDAAHKRLIDTLENKESLPIDLKDSVIYYMGPSPTPEGKVIGSAGPTTSHRMDKYTPILLDLGLKGMIGKGNRTEPVIKSIKKNKAVYFTAIGGAGALIQNHIKSNELIAYEDLGPEAIRKLEVEDFPVIVAIDSYGNNLYESAYLKFKKKRGGLRFMRMVIDSSVREAGTDPIFAVAARAAEAEKKFGKDKVINSTIGALMDDDGNLVTFDEVYNTLKNLPDAEISNYADIAGLPEFLENVQEACFRDQRPDAYIKAVATPGGTGAVRNAVANYTEYGDDILIPDWHWAPYQTIAQENRRGFTLFTLFNDQGRFNLEDYEKHFKELYQKQGRILSILNTPAHNPTGFSINDQEWDQLIDFWKKEAEENPDKPIIILLDIAYIDFAKEGSRNFMKKLEHLPENILILYAFSASKGYTMYGLRNGALICAAPTQEIADEFEASIVFSNRGTWSNGTRGAMKTLSDIISDEDSYQRFLVEQQENRDMLRRRGDVLVEEAKNEGLEICSYDDGFFMSIPCDNPKAVAEKLMDENIFLIALGNGLRVALCAISEEKCKKLPKAIKKAIKDLKEEN